jgi:hypothetical protein
MQERMNDPTDARGDPTPVGRQLRRIWTRTESCAGILFALALILPRIQSALDPQEERRAIARSVERASREQAPVYVMPNGERRRAVAVARAEPDLVDWPANRALFWWCGILAAVNIASAAAQTIRAYATRDEDGVA